MVIAYCTFALPQTLVGDLNFTGLLFESLVVRDMRVYAQANDAAVFHYRDNTGLEIDAIVQRASGAWAAFEGKLGGEAAIEDGARNLLTFASSISVRRRWGCLPRLPSSSRRDWGTFARTGCPSFPSGPSPLRDHFS
jgi:hypothetical protein